MKLVWRKKKKMLKKLMKLNNNKTPQRHHRLRHLHQFKYPSVAVIVKNLTV